jgi:hypothetical protein
VEEINIFLHARNGTLILKSSSPKPSHHTD